MFELRNLRGNGERITWLILTAAQTSRVMDCWDTNVMQVNVIKETNQMLHCQCRIIESNFSFLLTGVYGDNNGANIRTFWWEDILNLSTDLDSPWVVLGVAIRKTN